MCLIVAKKSGYEVPVKHFENGFTRNSDGAGYAFVKDGKVIVSKGFMSFDSFIDSYKASVRKEYPAIIHFRLATHGLKTGLNCHPFRVNENLAFVHNGVLSSPLLKDDIKSDTSMFNELCLKKLPKNFLSNKKIMKNINKFIGIANKLAFISNTGVISIVNMKEGIIKDGIWYSNNGFESYQYAAYDKYYYTSGYYICRRKECNVRLSLSIEQSLGYCYNCLDEMNLSYEYLENCKVIKENTRYLQWLSKKARERELELEKESREGNYY